MASKIKVDQIETVDGTGSITVNQPLSGSGAGLTSLPAANLTGSLPAISGASLTGILPAVGTSGNLLTSTGSAWASSTPAVAGFSEGTSIATTSGTTALFGSIPTGTTKIFMGLDGVGPGALSVYLGDAGGIESSGYKAAGTNLRNGAAVGTQYATDRFYLHDNASGFTGSGLIIFSRVNSTTNMWVMCGALANVESGNAYTFNCGGSKALSAELTQIRLSSAGTFNAGSVNISYM
jgi:hypothetical protein